MTPDVHLPEAPDDAVLQWVDGLADCRKNFAALGFRVPDATLALIEGTRVRTADERSYDRYQDEAMREYLALPRYWSAESRKALPVAVRSVYLDFLQREIDRGAFAGIDKAQATGVLDPNFILYNQMPFRNRALAEDWRSQLAAQKQMEIGAVKNRVDGVARAPNNITIVRLMELFERLSGSLSFARIEQQKVGDVRVSAVPTHESAYPVTLEWTDLALTQKHGNVQLHFIAEQSNRKRIPIQDILPGAEVYSLNNGDWYSIGLAVLSHLELLRLLSQLR